LLGAVSGSPNGMESGHLSPEAHQPHATRTDLDTHDRSCPAQAMQEGEAGHTRTARDHLGPGLAPILPQAPGLQGGPGDRQSLGGVTRGEPLGWSIALPLKPCGASSPLPLWAGARHCHVGRSGLQCLQLSPLPQPWPCEQWQAQDEEGAP
jgi:hypothetical protein